MSSEIELPDMRPEDIPEYLHDEISAFADKHQIVIDQSGFVHGNMLPTDVLQLGYLLISWVVLGKLIKKEGENATNI